ncbi:MAG: hypothetical protein ABI863_12675 [Ginsengibacter sp.]
MSHFGGIIAKSDKDAEGSPLLFDNWKSGEITLTNNQKISVEKINLDASRDVFVYEKNGSVYEFTDNAKEIKIYGEDHHTNPDSDMIFRTYVNPSMANFVQVFAEGKITVFCEYNKKPEGEYSSNGFVTTTRKYELYSNYYSLVNNKVTLIKFTSSTLEDLTSDKKDKLDTFIKENKLKVKKGFDFIKAIKFYNNISG